MSLRLIIAVVLGMFVAIGSPRAAQPSKPKPVPHLQAIPLPRSEISFQRDGVELTRYCFDTNQHRPFLYPVMGPAGRSITRMGHPHDPITHSHHNSIWISHHDIDGLSAWDDRGKLRVIHQRVELLEDGDDSASAVVVNHWMDTGGVVLLNEWRRITVRGLPKNEWQLVLDLRFEPHKDEVTLGKTPFGFIGVRMARSIGVDDGGGTIRNSSGAINEKDVFWKPARWVDYSGPITDSATEGITLMDHPTNPNHPAVFHVRNDGWMGASATFAAPRVLRRGQALSYRYGLYIHDGAPSTNTLQRHWQAFADDNPSPFLGPKKGKEKK